MSLVSKKILGIPITISSKINILEEINKYLKFPISNFQFPIKKINPFIIFTPNPEIIEYAQSDSEFKKTLSTPDINLPDGEGIVWAIHHIYKEKITRITGIDFMLDLCNLARKETVRIGLIGGKDRVALQTAERLKTMYPGLNIEVFEARQLESRIKNQESRIFEEKKDINSYFLIHDSEGKEIDEEEYFKNLVERIEKKKVSMLFVALGFPKQEYFIENLKLKIQNSKLKQPLILMAVGGSFDFISGKTSRAPAWIRDNGFEWMYRLIKEPFRIKRQLKGAKFFWRILKKDGFMVKLLNGFKTI